MITAAEAKHLTAAIVRKGIDEQYETVIGQAESKIRAAITEGQSQCEIHYWEEASTRCPEKQMLSDRINTEMRRLGYGVGNSQHRHSTHLSFAISVSW